MPLWTKACLAAALTAVKLLKIDHEIAEPWRYVDPNLWATVLVTTARPLLQPTLGSFADHAANSPKRNADPWLDVKPFCE